MLYENYGLGLQYHHDVEVFRNARDFCLVNTYYLPKAEKKVELLSLDFFNTMCDSGACFILQVLLNIYDTNMNLNNLDITWKYPLLQFEKIIRVVKVKQLSSWKHGRSQRIHPFMTIFEPRDLWNAKY